MNHLWFMAVLDQAIDLLEQLDVVLAAETEALRTVDAAAIEAAANRKEELEQQLVVVMAALRGTKIDAAARRRVEALRTSVVRRSEHNLRRLQATVTSIRELVGQLTGSETTTYGPKNRARGYQTATPARAVLTAEIG